MITIKRLLLPLCVIALLAQSASAETVQALQSDNFVDSIGINAHLDLSWYSPWSSVEPILTGLGVRHIRWGGNPSLSQTYYNELVELYGYGFTANMMVSTFTSGTLDPTQINSTLTSLQNISYSGTNILSGVESIEGPNEYDLSGDPSWCAHLVTYQQDLFNAMTSSTFPKYNNIAALAPALGNGDPDFPLLPDMDSSVDLGNAHPYNGTSNPEATNISTYLFYSLVAWPGRLLEESENGYSTIATSSGVSEAVQAKWIPRLLLDNYRLGVQRTFLYELNDAEEPGSTGDYFHHFGLVELTGTNPNTFKTKASYAAVQNLITILSDKGAAFTPGFFSYELSGTTTDVHELALQKRNGTYYLALWVAATGASSTSNNVTVTFAEPVSTVTQYTPVSSTTGTGLTLTNNGVSLSVPDAPVILAVTPTPLLTSGTCWADGMSSLGTAYSQSNWKTDTVTAGSWWGDSTVLDRTSDTTSDSLVYAAPGLDGFTARFGFPTTTTQPPGGLTFNLASHVTFYTSPDGSAWTVLPAYSGAFDKTKPNEAVASADWFQPMSPAASLPYGTNFIKIAITGTTGANTVPQLFQMNFSQNGKLEGEAMTLARSGAYGYGNVPSGYASGGRYNSISFTGVNEWGQYTGPNIPPGTYEVYFRYATGTGNGIAQFSIDGTNYGSAQDEYGTVSNQFIEADMGSVTWTTTANHVFQITVTGKNTSSSGYNLNMDRVVLKAKGR